jgi:hypothetical protein
MRLAVTTLLCCMAIAGGAIGAEGHGGHERGPYPYGPAEKIDPRQFFTGNTVAAVAYLPVAHPQPGPDATGASSLLTVMFRAFLRPDGTALVHSWDPRTASYTPTATQFWSLDGNTLCLSVPAFQRTDPLCLEVHIWGRNFAGYGVNGSHGMVKGDVKPGHVAGL